MIGWKNTSGDTELKSVYPLKKIKSGGDDEFIFRFSEVKAEYFNKFSFDNLVIPENIWSSAIINDSCHRTASLNQE